MTETFIKVEALYPYETNSMADVTDIKGIGPAKADTLAEEGYESLEDIANADQEELGAVDGVGNDRALEFIVGASNLLEEAEDDAEDDRDDFDLTPSEVSEELEEDGDSGESPEEGSAPDEDDELVEESESESESTFDVTISFQEEDEFHTFHAAVMRYHEAVYTSNQPASDAMRKILDGLDNRDSVSYELTEEELNTLHTAVKQTRTNYQGDNLIDHMDALSAVEEQVNEQRRELLF